MFDLSMVELGVIALVALLVLGPERLPKAARTLGFYVRKARQSWYSVRSEFERELAAEELKRSLKLDEVHATLEDTARSAREGLQVSAQSEPAHVAEPKFEAPASEGSIGGSRAADDSSDDGLTEEERARQCEALAPEAEFSEDAPSDRPAGAPERTASDADSLDQDSPVANPTSDVAVEGAASLPQSSEPKP
jgi:sec-independent protein translocase protein TatB